MIKKVIIIGAGVSGLSSAALLVKEKIPVQIFEKSNYVGGRTTSMVFRNHVLDNGLHIMPFYKTSAVYKILNDVGLLPKLKLSKVYNIAFYKDKKFHIYPKGITDILRMSIVPFKSRLTLLKTLLPMAFSSMEKAEKLDNRSLTELTKSFDQNTKSFFDAVCMLAFADTPDHVSLGEFVRTIIRANPFRGGTSEFAYPSDGGYDTISKILANHIKNNGADVNFNSSIKKIVVEKGKVNGIILSDGRFIEGDCIVITYPAYMAVNQLFDEGVFSKNLLKKINKLNKTTSVVEVHFCLTERIDTRQIVFPIGKNFTTKGIFFLSNITNSVSPEGEHLIMAGTPVATVDAENPARIKEIVDEMKKEISQIYPNFQKVLKWERPMAWKLVEAVVKEPGFVWKQKMPHTVPGIEGLFFVGDSTISYGIGTDSAAHSSILCHPKIVSFLKKSKLTKIEQVIQ
ncbi:MAG: phytoene desaturase family protein [Nitrosopumilaceae archaeon]